MALTLAAGTLALLDDALAGEIVAMNLAAETDPATCHAAWRNRNSFGSGKNCARGNEIPL
jgi:hypothetical protein